MKLARLPKHLRTGDVGTDTFLFLLIRFPRANEACRVDDGPRPDAVERRGDRGLVGDVELGAAGEAEGQAAMFRDAREGLSERPGRAGEDAGYGGGYFMQPPGNAL